MTATPHNGKDEDFQLFLKLLDADRFEGKVRPAHQEQDPSDMMRRMVKEDLLKFDGRPLFPERRAYTVGYDLSDGEARLYEAVTSYVRQEFNRAKALENNGRRGTVGFALTILQRRLASSPAAIYQSLHRRRERLQERVTEARLMNRARALGLDFPGDLPDLGDNERLAAFEDAPCEELEEMEEKLLGQATAAQTIVELEAEIQILKGLETLASEVRKSRTDCKWKELSRTLQDNPLMKDKQGNYRKMVIFTEHKDTLYYLVERLGSLLGSPDRVVTIHGSMRWDHRREAERAFKQDADVQILVATDAAGEGINLQRAHLMVNYDLPWNPNRLEQRFGRIHRIGQTEVCHLWNLVATETREGEVFQRLLQKLEVERESLAWVSGM
jgi:SNF2 family DNA or RNA helicase